MSLSQVIKKAMRVSAITIISRFLGYIRDIIVAAQIGTGLLNDVFIAAFKIVNLFRAIFAEGAFSAAFIPIFLEVSTKKDKKSAMQFAAEVQSVLIIVLLIFTIIMIVIMPFVMLITTPGFAKIPHAFDLVVHLGRIIFPYIIFISLAAFYGTIMNSAGIFSPFAATSIVLNIVMIIAALSNKYAQTPAHALTYGSLIAGVFEFLWMIYFAKKYNLLLPIYKPKVTILVKKTITKMIPSIVNFGVIQINILVSMMIASLVTDGMSYIYYADRIAQLPIALIGTAIGTVVLPSLAKAFELEQKKRIEAITYHTFGMVLFFSIPSTFVILYLSEDIIRSLFMRGYFTELSVINTAAALTALSIGVPAFSMNRLLITIFYSHKDTHTPMKISIITMCVNIVISLLLLHDMKHVGICIAAAAAGWLNVICFIVILKRKRYLYVTSKILKEIVKILISSCIMICVMHHTYKITETFRIESTFLPHDINRTLISMIPLCCSMILGLLVYILTNYLFNSETYNLLLHHKKLDHIDDQYD